MIYNAAFSSSDTLAAVDRHDRLDKERPNQEFPVLLCFLSYQVFLLLLWVPLILVLLSFLVDPLDQDIQANRYCLGRLFHPAFPLRLFDQDTLGHPLCRGNRADQLDPVGLQLLVVREYQ